MSKKTEIPIRRESKFPYVASLTDTVKAIIPCLREQGKYDLFLGLIDSAVATVVGDPEIAESLKKGKEEPGGVTMRGITMRSYYKGPAIVTCYVFWNDLYDCWHVLIESPSEGDGDNPCSFWDEGMQRKSRKDDFWKWN